jgi:hypothetical protein
MPLTEKKLVGYVLMGDIDPEIPGGVARLLYEEFRITQNWFSISHCIDECKENGIENPTVYTLDEFLKVIPKVHIGELD